MKEEKEVNMMSLFGCVREEKELRNNQIRSQHFKRVQKKDNG